MLVLTIRYQGAQIAIYALHIRPGNPLLATQNPLLAIRYQGAQIAICVFLIKPGDPLLAAQESPREHPGG